MSRKVVLCQSCRRDMVDDVTGTAMIGLSIQMPEGGEVFQRIYPDLPLPLEIHICFACWIRSLGVPVTTKS